MSFKHRSWVQSSCYYCWSIQCCSSKGQHAHFWHGAHLTAFPLLKIQLRLLMYQLSYYINAYCFCLQSHGKNWMGPNTDLSSNRDQENTDCWNLRCYQIPFRVEGGVAVLCTMSPLSLLLLTLSSYFWVSLHEVLHGFFFVFFLLFNNIQWLPSWFLGGMTDHAYRSPPSYYHCTSKFLKKRISYILAWNVG